MRSTGVAAMLALVAGIVVIAHSDRIASSIALASGSLQAQTQSAAAFFVDRVTIASLRNTYAQTTSNPAQLHTVLPAGASSSDQIKVLIVPGHEPLSGGTAFGGVYERNIVVDIANDLAAYLSQNPRFSVFVARDKTAWSPTLQSYFDQHEADIETFELSQASQMLSQEENGTIQPLPAEVDHSLAGSIGALHLYGINKWASDNQYDITIHLHINDYPRVPSQIGKYDGFALYVPDHQYSNAAASAALAHAVAVRLNAYHATSTLPLEQSGIIEDQHLIAIGSNNSVDDASFLIEYGYIYEPQFQNPTVLPLAEQDYAYQTYLGLKDFFKDPVATTTGSAAVPYDWSSVAISSGDKGPGVYALQSALHYLGYYPVAGKSFDECPISGVDGDCTKAALQSFQDSHGIPANGTFDNATKQELVKDLASRASAVQ